MTLTSRVPIANRLYRIGLSVLGVGTVSAMGYYAVSRRLDPQSERPSNIVGPSASTLTNAIVESVLRDPKVVDRAVDLVVKAFLHPHATKALKEHFVSEFTDNEETLTALKKFAVNDVIQDPWVSEELILLSKRLGKQLIADPVIWPEGSLNLLKEAALEGLEQDRFKQAAVSVAKSVVV